MEVDNVYAAPPLINMNLSKTIGFGGSASVYTAKWMETTTTYAIKRFRNSSRDDIINEVYLMGKVNCHPNIIKICGVTKFKDETNYSLILEYADSGTLGKYLRENAATFRWEDQLKFANDIASAVLYLHRHQIIHGDLHPGNSNILEGMREKPYPGTNHKFIALYKKCWQHEPNIRPEIRQVILELEELNNNEPLVVSEIFGSEEIETTLEISETPENDEVNVPSYDCDINKYKL
ncbi:unnamed protein product [Rhizophagus irregularis]|nr:unnamed protein product [Rhizophagus irregularis]